MTPSAQHVLVTIAIIALIAWRMHSRIRRTIGRQRLSPVRPWITIVLFPLVIALLAFASLRAPQPIWIYLAGGAVAGIGLGLLGLRLTRFEVTPAGRFYTPSAHLGVALSVLLVCRIAWRFAAGGFPGSAGASSAPPGASLTPLTLLLVGMLAGYYTTYAVGLVRWSARSRDLLPSQAPDSGGA